jgi:hypothetical protein
MPPVTYWGTRANEGLLDLGGILQPLCRLSSDLPFSKNPEDGPRSGDSGLALIGRYVDGLRAL